MGLNTEANSVSISISKVIGTLVRVRVYVVLYKSPMTWSNPSNSIQVNNRIVHKYGEKCKVFTGPLFSFTEHGNPVFEAAMT